MHLVPFLAGLVAALVLAPVLRNGLIQAGATRPNYRVVELPIPFGILLPAAVALAAGPLAVLAAAGVDEALALGPFGFVAGAALLGLVDDAYSGPSRGWRGHARALLKGEPSTGALKAFGILGLAAFYAGPARAFDDADATARWLLTALTLVLATNVFNLLDLRPGRTGKAFILLAAALLLLAPDAARAGQFGLYAAPILVAFAYDLRERAMLGDAGSNAIGAVAGLWLVASISSTAGLAACAATLLAITAYAEFRSLSAFIERTPVLKHLDSIGRPA